MAINFPNNPAVNDTTTVGVNTWIWNGTTWEVLPQTSPNFIDVSVSGTLTGNVLGNVTGNLDGNVTGNVTGNVIGNLQGNATTSTKLATGRTINDVSFDGSQNITVNKLINSTATITLNSSGQLQIPGNINAGAVNTKIISSSSAGLSRVDAVDSNLIYNIEVNNSGAEVSFFNISGLQKQWQFSTSGNLIAPGNISTSTGTITAVNATVTNTVQANTISVTDTVTVGSNVNISTPPTNAQHATNKGYVDSRSIALSVALS